MEAKIRTYRVSCNKRRASNKRRPLISVAYFQTQIRISAALQQVPQLKMRRLLET